jgi:hypothetical protein
MILNNLLHWITLEEEDNGQISVDSGDNMRVVPASVSIDSTGEEPDWNPTTRATFYANHLATMGSSTGHWIYKESDSYESRSSSDLL